MTRLHLMLTWLSVLFLAFPAQGQVCPTCPAPSGQYGAPQFYFAPQAYGGCNGGGMSYAPQYGAYAAPQYAYAPQYAPAPQVMQSYAPMYQYAPQPIPFAIPRRRFELDVRLQLGRPRPLYVWR